MPIVESKYTAPLIFRNKHLATILPSVFRKINANYTRERINTSDGDFIDIDWQKGKNDKLAILTHGLEGHSERHYITATANYLSLRGWDVAAWNCRSCSGEMNLKPRLYSHIDAPDLGEVIDHVLMSGKYKKISLVGFSMGGAITLNYLTKYQELHPKELRSAVVISAPIDVQASSQALEKAENKFYRKRFLKKMVDRAIRKSSQFPDLIDTTNADKIFTFKEYDERFTAKLNHCYSPEEFYQKAATKSVLDKVAIDTLLLIAKDDPFMSENCYPYKEAQSNPRLYLEVPANGGHVGFSRLPMRNSYMEERVYEFLSEKI